MSQRSVILGAVAHLPISALEPFSRSLRATGFDGRLCIVAAGYTADQLEELRVLANHVRSVDGEYATSTLARTTRALAFVRTRRGIRRLYPRLFEAVARAAPERKSFERWRTLEYRLEGLQSLRYMHYYRYLVEDAADADVVMITDVRDVIFQRDPFADPVIGLELYLEDASVRIGGDDFNTRWLRNLFGQEFIDANGGKPVSCSGTVVGTRAAMMVYLSEMMTEIAWRRRPMGPHDQGVHNGLIQTGRLTSTMLIPNETGRVLTLGKMKRPNSNRDGILINSDESVPAIVHQWDRHESLFAELPALHLNSVARRT